MQGVIEYFDKAGKDNTARTLELARERALALGIRDVLVASSHGYTALEAARIFAGTDVRLTAVTISAAYEQEGWCMTGEERQAVEQAGVRVLTTQHSLSGGAAEAFLGGGSPLSVVAQTLYCFSQGVKVAVEIALMAAEAGVVAPGTEIISVAGTNEGADTALVLAPAHARRFTDLRVCEILCKPRVG